MVCMGESIVSDFARKAIFYSFLSLLMLTVALAVYRDVTYDAVIRLSIRDESTNRITIRTFGVEIGDTITLLQRDDWYADYTITIKEFLDNSIIVALGGSKFFVSFHGTVNEGQPLVLYYGEVYHIFIARGHGGVGPFGSWRLMFR